MHKDSLKGGNFMINKSDIIVNAMTMPEPKKLHIGYFADGEWGHRSFNKMLADETLAIDFVCVRYDKKDKLLMNLASEHHIDVLYTPNINSAEFVNVLKQYSSELYVSMSFNQIFHDEVRAIPQKSIINCHAGKLPFYRGRNILNWALINDEKEFGITVHYVDSGIDTGDIILQRVYEITDKDNYNTLLNKAYEECPMVLYEAIKMIQAGNAERIQQKHIASAGLYCGMRVENDEILDWNQESREIFNFIRAITHPGPCACSFVDGRKIKLAASELVPDAPVYKGIPGQVLLKNKDHILVKTKDSYIKITDYEGTVKVGDRMRMS